MKKIFFLSSLFILSFSILSAHEEEVKKTKTSPTLLTELKSLTEDIRNINNPSVTKKLQLQSADTLSLVEKAKKRKEILLNIAKTEPAIFNQYAIKTKEKTLLPDEVKPYVEDFKKISGRLTVVHVDGLEGKDKGFTYFLNSEKRKLRLVSEKTFPALTSNQIMNAEGFELGNIFVAQAVSFDKSTSQNNKSILGPQKLLILLVDFSNSSSQPITPKKAHQLVFNGQPQSFYKEQSYDLMSLEGSVLGWIRVNKPYNYSYCGDFGIQDEKDISDFIKNNNINLASYNHVVFLFSAPGTGGGCSEVGKSSNYIDGKEYFFSTSWIPLTPDLFEKNGKHPFAWSHFDAVFVHELGHALGVMHANAWQCSGTSLYTGCQHAEYANLFDVMGFGIHALHFNAFYKEILGWIPSFSKRILEITKSGEHTLSSFHLKEGKVLAKISNPFLTEYKGLDHKYYLEYRQPVGFDSGLGSENVKLNTLGLFVNHVIDYKDGSLPFPRLIDVSYLKPNEDDDFTLVVVDNQYILEDRGRGITIGPVTTSTPEFVKFNVNFATPECISVAPSVAIDQGKIITRKGDKFVVTILVTNNDSFGCGASEHVVEVRSPQSWIVSFLQPSQLVFGSGVRRSQSVQIEIPQDQISKTVLVPIVVKNKKSNKASVHTMSIQIKD